ncbi:hypothetical protein VA7868_03160 [Vibrio aerogenes CECT 7868]|uniref:SAF domain-containing protein n=1 Tax=Vibrio aerogenes CECT 7868 TaxID=1216006 RepID=A0A1M5ZSP4_9VIBR|nr:Flp pilus assembly protein CpaB [Vibrio aerogenes]SHI27234.1 hypothetical protein VA7868_03160 [Vibrio aerogenes CECT 7868]
MKISSVLFISGAFVIALGGAFVVRGLMIPPVKPVPKPQPVVQVKAAPVYTPVLAANRDLQPGEFIDGGAIRWQAVDKDYPAELYIKKDSTDLAYNYGATVRRFVRKGELLTYALVVKSGEPGFLASVLAKGMRAVAIPTNAVASNAGLVSAGDRVDVILGLSRKDSSDARQASKKSGKVPAIQAPVLASQTLVTNVRVLALNNVAESELRVRPDEKDKAEDSRSQYFETVTLEVTPKQAEQLAVAREIGTLQLALRSVDDDEPGNEQSTTPLSAGNQLAEVTTLEQVTEIYQKLNDVPSTPAVVVYMGSQKPLVTHVTN